MPTSNALSSTREPPTKMTRARPKAERNSTAGKRTACILPASRFAPRFSELAAPKERMFAPSRFMLWTTRTPDMFSWRPALTAEMALRALMKARRANLCQTAIITNSSGMSSRVVTASRAFMLTITTMIPPRLRMSAAVMITTDRNSWSCCTSFWTLDITRPTSFLL